MKRDFLVGRNPDFGSRLPFLLYLPLGDDGVWLKARESWPRSSRVFCELLSRPPICDVECIERVRVLACRRHGTAIDLLLDRPQNRRSQFVCVRYRGRQMIFWQTPKAAQSAKPGVRIPRAPMKSKEVYYIDSRERYGYTFAGRAKERRTLRTGDYAVLDAKGQIIAAVERKTKDDFRTSIVDASLSFEMLELASLPHAVVVVECSYSTILKDRYLTPGYLPELIARLAVLYPHVPLLFLETRRVAEEWVLRYLRLAYANASAASLPLLSATAE